MTVRTRNRTNTTLTSGFYHVVLGNVTTPHSVTHGLTEKCEDVIGNFPEPNPLKVTQKRTYIPAITGETVGGSPPAVIRSYVNCPLGSGVKVDPPSTAIAFPTPSSATKASLAWKILAETNPSAPDVSIPAFIGEMKDLANLPLKVKDWGGSLLRKIALGHITWRWAIKPMISDLQKLIFFTEDTDRRFREIVNLSRGRKIRKRVSLGSSIAQTVSNNVLRHSENFLVSYRRTLTNSVKEWGSSQWRIADGSIIPRTLSKADLAKMHDLATDINLGLTSHEALAAAWELCPWSWFVDWFVNVGDVIAATNNTLGLHWDSVCYMRTITSRYDYELTSTWPSGYTISGIPYESEVVKERYVVSPTLSVSPSFRPLLAQKTWSILGSLAALRLEKPPRGLRIR
jgi:hypothetical protein